MSETMMRKKVIKVLSGLHAVPIENPIGAGTPDVNYVEGWIELKWLREWPKRATTIVQVPHYTDQQQVWAFKRRRAGGQCWFLLQVRRDWLLLDGGVAAFVINRTTRQELIENATAYWDAGLPDSDLKELLTECQDPFEYSLAELAQLRGLS
jgi:hypothetical protein